MVAHRHFMEGAGHTEHKLFVQMLLAPKDSRPVAKGKVKEAVKKAAEASQRRSQRLKSMLEPPGVSTQNSDAEPLQDGSHEKELILDPARMAEILPGAAPDSTQVGVLYCCSREAESMCMARTKTEGRPVSKQSAAPIELLQKALRGSHVARVHVAAFQIR